ncbi:MAG: phosphoadenosine phosphosulfate reductase family protein [Christensenellales bacterium]|jgi:GMP synthase (glutamine-hydrolysing)
MQDQLIILNFDKQYAAALASRLRAEAIYCRILPGESGAADIHAINPRGLILAGGVSGQFMGEIDPELLRLDIPVLALGDAAPVAATLLGAEAWEKRAVNDVGTVKFVPSPISGEMDEIDRQLQFVSPLTLPEGMEPLARWDDAVIGAWHCEKQVYTLQCQLEANDMDMMGLLLRFATDVCGCTPWWSEEAFIDKTKAAIAQKVGNGKAVCIMSGGLSSGVNALLAHRVLGERLQCLFVDTGLLRAQETERFVAYYRERMGLNLQVIHAQSQFLEALAGLEKPEDKLAAIMRTLQDMFQQAMEALDYDVLILPGNASQLMEGPEVVMPIPAIRQHKPVMRPLEELFKEEIRFVGEELGMPQELTHMQPFPWMGLALRVIGECTAEKLNMLRQADAMFCEEIRGAGLNRKLWKYYALLYHLPHRGEHSAAVLVLRAVTASHQGGAVHALAARLPYDLLERYTLRVREACPQVCKVVYDLTPDSGSLHDAEWQ